LDKSSGSSIIKESSQTETKKTLDLPEDQPTKKQQLSQSTASTSTEEKASISEVAAALSGTDSSIELKNGKLVSDDKGTNSMSFTEYADSKS